MQVRIPADYRQPFRWFGNLDAMALASLVICGALGAGTLQGSGPAPLRIAEAAFFGLLGVTLAFGKWPLDETGDRILPWILRLIGYLRRERRASIFSPSSGRTPHSVPPAIGQLVDVQSIGPRAVQKKDGSFVAMVEVEGEFFRLLSEVEQDERILAFAGILNSVRWPIQITLLVEPVDISTWRRSVEERAEKAKDSALSILASATVQTAMDFARDVLEETVVISVTAPTEPDADRRAEQLEALFRRAGFQARRVGKNRAFELLHGAFGHAGRAALPAPSWRDIAKRNVGQPKESVKKARGGIVVTPPQEDVLGPNIETEMELLVPPAVVETPGMLDLGGTFAATLIAVRYPPDVGNGWLEPVLHFGHASVRRRVSLLLSPIPTDRAVAEISRKLVDLTVVQHSALRQGRATDPDSDAALDDATQIRQDLARGYQRMFDVTLAVTLLGKSREEVREAVERLKMEAAGFQLLLRETYLEESLGFRMTMPLLVNTIRRVRPIPTIPLATAFPFTAGELLHPTGDFWGANLMTGNAVIVDPRRYQPPHMMFVAATGSGKSFTVKTLATQTLIRGDEDVLIIDPSPPVDYERWTNALGGLYLRLGVGTNTRINPCEILPPAGMDLQQLSQDDDFARPVTQKVAFLKALFEVMAYPEGNMPAVDRARLEVPLFAMYAERGMTDDWRTILDSSSLSAKPKAKPSPTLHDALRHIRATDGLEELALRLQPYVEGTLNLFADATNVDLNSPLVVFNVWGLVQREMAGAHLQSVAYAMVMEALASRLADQGRRKLLIVDEAHVLFARKETARFLSRLYRMARKQGGRVAILTQSVTDLVGDPETGVQVQGEEEARVCLGQTGILFFLRNDKRSDLRVISGSVCELTPGEQRFLRDAEPGQGLLVAGSDRCLVQVVAPRELYPLITTKPEEVAV